MNCSKPIQIDLPWAMKVSVYKLVELFQELPHISLMRQMQMTGYFAADDLKGL